MPQMNYFYVVLVHIWSQIQENKLSHTNWRVNTPCLGLREETGWSWSLWPFRRNVWRGGEYLWPVTVWVVLCHVKFKFSVPPPVLSVWLCSPAGPKCNLWLHKSHEHFTWQMCDNSNTCLQASSSPRGSSDRKMTSSEEAWSSHKMLPHYLDKATALPAYICDAMTSLLCCTS